jgi:hypothetical protein
MNAKGAVREPQTIDGATLALVPTPGRRKAQLDKLEGVRREMSRVYRDMESGNTPSALVDHSVLHRPVESTRDCGHFVSARELELPANAVEILP